MTFWYLLGFSYSLSVAGTGYHHYVFSTLLRICLFWPEGPYCIFFANSLQKFVIMQSSSKAQSHVNCHFQLFCFALFFIACDWKLDSRLLLKSYFVTMSC